MRDWQSSSVERILSYSPQRVLEIGAGVGQLLFNIAPHCSTYCAVDSSQKAVEAIRPHLAPLPQAVYKHYDAYSFPIAEGKYDTVIINSVAQYFPSINCLFTVIERAIRAPIFPTSLPAITSWQCVASVTLGILHHPRRWMVSIRVLAILPLTSPSLHVPCDSLMKLATLDI